MGNWLSILGSIASIFGALWALSEAKKASSAATKAEMFRDEIINRRKMIEVSQVYAETRRILNTVSKVGPASNPQLLRGISCASIAVEVEEYSRFINEQSAHFTEFFENSAQKLCDDLQEDIEALAEAKSFDEKKTAGKKIYYKIKNFMPIVKDMADEKKETIEQ